MSTLKPQLDKTRAIFEALDQGIHPHTKQELPRDSIVNDIDVNRAIGTAMMAIDQLRAQLARRASLPEGVGKAWTEEEEQQLRNEFANGMGVEEIAKAHRRTIRAIETRAVMRDLMKTRDRITDIPFSAPARKKDKK